MSGYDEVISTTLADLDRARRGLEDAHERIAGATATVRSRNRMVSATVDPQGQLLDLTLHGDGHKSMPAAELAALVTGTIEQARTECAEQVTSALRDAFGGDLGRFDPAAPLDDDFEQFVSGVLLEQIPGAGEESARQFRDAWREES